jgi:hypothetical protein
MDSVFIQLQINQIIDFPLLIPTILDPCDPRIASFRVLHQKFSAKVLTALTVDGVQPLGRVVDAESENGATSTPVRFIQTVQFHGAWSSLEEIASKPPAMV